MAHLTYTESQEALADADEIYAADLIALNSSGVSGSVVFSIDYDTMTMNVAVGATGLAADQEHLQHVHGVFDEDGNPANSTTPTLASDADQDGMVEVLEGVGSYGDILLPLSEDDGSSPMSDSSGGLNYVQTFDLTDDSLFFSPVTGGDYTFEDLIELYLREYVIHGVDVPAGVGTGTEGEVDGSGGYTALLPAAAAEIEVVDADTATFLLNDMFNDASTETYLNAQDNMFNAGAGNDTVRAGKGDDTIKGGDDDDQLIGADGNDFLSGGTDHDVLIGGNGADQLNGNDGNDLVLGDAGADVVMGGAGMDSVWAGNGADSVDGGAHDDMLVGEGGNDSLFGSGGNDLMKGGAGDDLIVGGDGMDTMVGGDGDDIFGGLAGNDNIKGGSGADEFHFDAGTGSDQISDFTQGEDVISFLDDGAISFANSVETAGRGDSDLSAADFDTIDSYAQLDAMNDQQVVYSNGGLTDLQIGTGGAAVEAYIAGSNGSSSVIYYDDDWSTLEGREEIAVLSGVDMPMTVSDFDVY